MRQQRHPKSPQLLCHRWASSFLALVVSCLSGFGLAQIHDPDFVMATDAASEHLFLVNPAVVPTKGHKVGFAAGKNTKDARLTLSRQGADDDVTETSTKEDIIGLAAFGDLGGGAGAGISGTRRFQDRKTRTESQRTEQLEQFRDDQIRGRFVVAISDKVRIGLLVRYYATSAGILPSEFAQAAQRISYHGTATGYGGGIHVRTPTASAGLAYIAPARGRANIEGENKVIQDHGQVEAGATFSLFERSQFGVLLQRWLVKRDDRDLGTPSAANPNTNVSLYGLSPERFIVPYQLYALGMDFGDAKDGVLRVTWMRELHEYLTDPTQIPIQDADHETNTDLYRVALGLNRDAFFLDFFAAYFKRSLQDDGTAGRSVDYLAQGRLFGLVLGLGL